MLLFILIVFSLPLLTRSPLHSSCLLSSLKWKVRFKKVVGASRTRPSPHHLSSPIHIQTGKSTRTHTREQQCRPRVCTSRGAKALSPVAMPGVPAKRPSPLHPGRWLVTEAPLSLARIPAVCRAWCWGVERVTSLGLHTTTLRWVGFSLFTNKALESPRR